MSSPEPPAPDGRSVPPRPTIRTDLRDNLDDAAADPNWRPMPGAINPAMVSVMAAQQQQRASLSSMLFLTFFFFMMSGGNGGNHADLIDVQNRVHEQDFLQVVVNDYELFLNHSASNYSYPPEPDPPMVTLLPPDLLHQPRSHYYQNITGFYRKADTHFLNLTEPGASSSIHSFFRHLLRPSSPSRDKDEVQDGGLARRLLRRLVGTKPDATAPAPVQLPSLKRLPGQYNESQAAIERGDWPWQDVVSWETNLNERAIEVPPVIEGHNVTDHLDWSWVHCVLTLKSKDQESIAYDLRGLHHKPTGNIKLLGRPEGQSPGLRDLPILYPERERSKISQLVMWDLKRQLKKLQDSMFWTEHEEDDPYPVSTCRLHLELQLSPVPAWYTADDLKLYEEELRYPTGMSLRAPPVGIHLNGVASLGDCGFAIGLNGGDGLEADAFWEKSIHYAAFAVAINLLILVLFVRQMEATRTPSGLAKVSFWTIAMMISADSWQFSAHVVIGIVSDNKTSLPMLVPGFCCLCTAVIFGPRFAVMLYRVQSPETPRRRPNATAGRTPETVPLTGGTGEALASGGDPSPLAQRWETLRNAVDAHPQAKWLFIGVVLLSILYFGLSPQIIPIFLGLLYSYWLPQIWRNARRGTRKALSWSFVVGSSLARLALPLYAFACPSNVFFVETNDWVWLLLVWQLFQVAVLVAQDRFHPAFFLPKRFAPPEAYDYHPVMSTSDPEAQQQQFGDCSICMEPIIVHLDQQSHASSTPQSAAAQASSAVNTVGSKVLSMQLRRTYALAPCHHMFHTACLAQWLAVKNVCPLCKRTLPPM